MSAEIVWDRKAIEELTRGKSGPMAKDLKRRSAKIEACAKRRAPVDFGILRNSIDSTLGVDKRGLFVNIGSGVEYAAAVHEGVHATQNVRAHVRVDGSRVRSHQRRVDRPGTPYLSACLTNGG